MAIMTTALIVRSCGIYSFSGTSIQPDVKTVTINYFEYKALKVNPTLSNSMTESLKDKFRKMTRLEQVDMAIWRLPARLPAMTCAQWR